MRCDQATAPGTWSRRLLWALYAVMWAGGVASYLIRGGVRPGDEWAAPLFLAIASIIVLVSAQPRARAALVLAGMLGFLAEWVGLTGGWLFGRYTYTEVLSPAVVGVPVVMASAWLVLAAYVHVLIEPLRVPAPIGLAVGAGVLTAIDLIIDPLAAGPLGYWRWLDGGTYYGVPAHNFAGWVVAGGLILAVLRLTAGHGESIPSARPVGLSIVLFFTVLAAGLELVLPAAVGGALMVLHVLLARSRGAVRWGRAAAGAP